MRLKGVRAQVLVQQGIVAIDWTRTPTGLQINTTLPANTVGKVILPTHPAGWATLSEDGSLVWSAKEGPVAPDQRSLGIGVASSDISGSVSVFIGSGSYHFEATLV